jgi:hypothetical protein
MLQSNSSLRHLDIDGVPLSVEQLQQLCPAIQNNAVLLTLRMAECGLTDVGARLLAAALRVNRTLGVLVLDRNEIGDKGALAFVALMQFALLCSPPLSTATTTFESNRISAPVAAQVRARCALSLGDAR